MLPEIAELKLPEVTQETEQKKDLGKNFLFDFKKKDFILENGRLIEIDGIKAIQVWIEKILRTQKFKWEIYEGVDYGTTIEDLIVGHGYPMSFLDSELKREITEALLKHPRIEGLSEWEFKRENDKLHVIFTVNLRDGKAFNKEVAF